MDGTETEFTDQSVVRGDTQSTCDCGGAQRRRKDFDQVASCDDPLFCELVWEAYECVVCGKVEYEPID